MTRHLRQIVVACTLLASAGLMAQVQAAVGAVDASKASPAPVVPPSTAKPKGSGSTGLDDRIKTTADDAPQKSGKRSGVGKYVMRCWQYGRLVLEEPRDSLLAESAKVLTVARGGDAGETVQLVDMVSATCTVSMSP